MLSSLSRFAAAEVRFLTFRPTPIGREELPSFLTWALLFTWLAGVGRYWDHPNAELWQYAGLGSVAYVYVLALVLWLVVLPLKPRAWSYPSVLLFVAMTSPPAILYAVPVERFTSFDAATSLNAWFLVVVAAWRVALLLRHLTVTAQLGRKLGVTAALLPLAGIVCALTVLNLEQATFEFMASPKADERTTNDGAYRLVFTLTLASQLLIIPLLFNYIAAVTARYKAGKEGSQSGEA